MSIRLATTAMVGLGAVTACGLAAGMIHAESREVEERSSLASSMWSVEASSDHGVTWDIPVTAADDGQLALSVDTRSLRKSSEYRSFTLRTSTGSLDGADVDLRPAQLISGDAEAASGLGVRAVRSQDGTCASNAFERVGNSSLFAETDRGAPQAFDNRVSRTGLELPPATRTTSGQPVTVCVEISLDAMAPTPDDVVEFGWPVDAAPKDAEHFDETPDSA